MFTVQPSPLAQAIRTVPHEALSSVRTVRSGRSIAYRRRQYKADAGVWGVDCHRCPPSIIWKCSMHGTNGRPAPPSLLACILLSAKSMAMVFRKLDLCRPLETCVLELRARQPRSRWPVSGRRTTHPCQQGQPARLSIRACLSTSGQSKPIPGVALGVSIHSIPLLEGW